MSPGEKPERLEVVIRRLQGNNEARVLLKNKETVIAVGKLLGHSYPNEK